MTPAKQYNYLLKLQHYLAITYVPATFLQDFNVSAALLVGNTYVKRYFHP
jgi:hypothetical protein